MLYNNSYRVHLGHPFRALAFHQAAYAAFGSQKITNMTSPLHLEISLMQLAFVSFKLKNRLGDPFKTGMHMATSHVDGILMEAMELKREGEAYGFDMINENSHLVITNWVVA